MCIRGVHCRRDRERCAVQRSRRGAQSYHYGGSRHSLLIAGFQHESQTNGRTDGQTNARSFARSPSLCFPRPARTYNIERERKRERERERERERGTAFPCACHVQARASTPQRRRAHAHASGAHVHTTFLLAFISVNMPPRTLRYFVADCSWTEVFK
jgi:hypothetical protein